MSPPDGSSHLNADALIEAPSAKTSKSVIENTRKRPFAQVESDAVKDGGSSTTSATAGDAEAPERTSKRAATEERCREAAEEVNSGVSTPSVKVPDGASKAPAGLTTDTPPPQSTGDPISQTVVTPPRARSSLRSSPSSVPPRCPYLGSIKRDVLDFDFEKLCSKNSSNQRVYGCLVCGKYFQGRGEKTNARIHAHDERHYLFINLSDTRVFCLPDDYEVVDASLGDIKYHLNPTFTPQEVSEMSTVARSSKALDGSDYIPGCIGLNNLRQTDCFNVIIQALCTVIPLRNVMLLLDLREKQSPDPVLLSFSELVRKIYNPRNFKGIVSPHEFLQAVSVASSKRFRIGQQSDPLALLAWLLNRLHLKLKSKSSGDDSVIHRSFQGEVLVTSVKQDVRGKPIETEEPTESKVPFLYITLDIPNAPVFKDSLNRSMIPHMPIFDALQKFDGVSLHESGRNELRQYSLWRLPPYLVVHVKRFSKNNFFVEKNPTIVTFPVKNFDFKDYLHPDARSLNPVTRYDLVANVCHVGKPQNGSYKVHVFYAPTAEWYEIEDLRVIPVLPQMVALSESYVQIYQRQDVKPEKASNPPTERSSSAESTTAVMSDD